MNLPKGALGMACHALILFFITFEVLFIINGMYTSNLIKNKIFTHSLAYPVILRNTLQITKTSVQFQTAIYVI